MPPYCTHTRRLVGVAASYTTEQGWKKMWEEKMEMVRGRVESKKKNEKKEGKRK